MGRSPEGQRDDHGNEPAGAVDLFRANLFILSQQNTHHDPAKPLTPDVSSSSLSVLTALDAFYLEHRRLRRALTDD